MKSTINIKNTELSLLPNVIQISPLGRPFRLSGICILSNLEAKYINGMYLHSTIYTFIYLDVAEFFNFEFDAFGKFIRKFKD